MNDSPKEPSPFDFEEEEVGAKGSVRSGGSRTFLRWSIIVTAISFAVSLAGSVMGNNVTGDFQLESIAFALNRFGMMAMLLGCIGIFAAFRWPALAKSFAPGKKQKKMWSPWWSLLFWNGVGLIAMVSMSLVLAFLFRANAIYFLSAILPIFLPLTLVMGIWHQGVTRAFWLGVMMSFLFARGNTYTWLSFFFSAWMQSYYPPGYGYSPSGMPSSIGIFENAPVFASWVGMLIELVQSQVAGLMCAGYVLLVESSRRRKSNFEAKLREMESKPTDPLQVPPALTKMD